MAVTERHAEVSPLVKHKAIVVCRNVLTRHSSAEGIEPSGLGLTAKDAILPTPVCT